MADAIGAGESTAQLPNVRLLWKSVRSGFSRRRGQYGEAAGCQRDQFFALFDP